MLIGKVVQKPEAPVNPRTLEYKYMAVARHQFTTKKICKNENKNTEIKMMYEYKKFNSSAQNCTSVSIKYKD